MKWLAVATIPLTLGACASNDCGARALARVMGPEADVATLHAHTYTPGRGGTLPTDMVGAARRHGYTPQRIDGWPSLRAALASGREVIALQNRRVSWWPQWHYTVVTGYDAAADQVRLSDDEPWDREAFIDSWDDGGFWGLVVTR